ncbi:hypothetical protein B0T16DRAFT_86924 [Cercophora newfieldiana]|uniref:Uncharacterized protein n=1 Tax=Cercophora newfieldiana TaxID=92897 RepID=A0AA40CWI6_9PEZI|nr:hypothetical protein B0T16DRAFT_86924 [Cercophora newfieldiana]
MEGTMFKSTLGGGCQTSNATPAPNFDSSWHAAPPPARSLSGRRMPCLLTLASCYLSLYPLVQVVRRLEDRGGPMVGTHVFSVLQTPEISSFGLLPPPKLMLRHQSRPGSWGTRTQTGGKMPPGYAKRVAVVVWWVRFSPTLLFETMLLPCLAGVGFQCRRSTLQPPNQGKGKVSNVSRPAATTSGGKSNCCGANNSTKEHECFSGLQHHIDTTTIGR